VTDPSNLDPHRRTFLKLLAAGGGALLLPRSLRAAVPVDANAPDAPRLLVVFQRGGCDAASVLVPWSSDDYHRLRPNTAIPRPDPADPKASDWLDDSWSLHPALRESMLPLWRRKELAFVPFAGTDDLSRSHFETQERIEEGFGPDIDLGGASGWISRLVGLLDPDLRNLLHRRSPRHLLWQGGHSESALARSAQGPLRRPPERAAGAALPGRHAGSGGEIRTEDPGRHREDVRRRDAGGQRPGHQRRGIRTGGPPHGKPPAQALPRGLRGRGWLGHAREPRRLPGPAREPSRQPGSGVCPPCATNWATPGPAPWWWS
jgi:hypothetical protein